MPLTCHYISSDYIVVRMHKEEAIKEHVKQNVIYMSLHLLLICINKTYQITCDIRYQKTKNRFLYWTAGGLRQIPRLCPLSLQLGQVTTLLTGLRSSTQTLFFFGRPRYLLANVGKNAFTKARLPLLSIMGGM